MTNPFVDGGGIGPGVGLCRRLEFRDYPARTGPLRGSEVRRYQGAVREDLEIINLLDINRTTENISEAQDLPVSVFYSLSLEYSD